MTGMKHVYKITYPNGKTYIGMDLTGSLTYFGSPNAKLVASDFTTEEQRDFTARKQILWESDVATEEELTAMEIKMIRDHCSNDPKIGYNRFPPFRSNIQ